MQGALSDHYAEALTNAVFAPGSGLKPDEAVRQFKLAEGIISGSKELVAAFLTPAVGKAKKMSIISRLADEMNIHRLIHNFLLVVVQHRRVPDLRAMRESFEEIVDLRLGWVKAEIVSARTLDKDQREEIERALGSKLGKFIRANYLVDPSLIGGVRARVASKEYDATVRGKLDHMRQRLTAGA
jgi:F-type H+-transporting ATPase subunit delta